MTKDKWEDLKAKMKQDEEKGMRCHGCGCFVVPTKKENTCPICSAQLGLKQKQ